MSDPFPREVYLVTGANRGIGLALTRAFVASGKLVIAGCRNPEAATGLRQLAREYPDAIDLIICDVANEQGLQSVAEEARKRRGNLDVIVNNGAIMPEQGNESIVQIDLSLFSKAFDTNVLGPVRVIRAFYSMLIASARPRVVNVSSGLGSIADREGYDYYPYAISKAALNMLTRSLAFELGPKGVTVVAISPGWVRTDMGGQAAPLSPEQSAKSLAATVEKIGPEQNGQFLSRDGKTGEYLW
jgi:NAD(P)-dependent dehydrogenase (short-subunit alcohol dehydrogenase family)